MAAAGGFVVADIPKKELSLLDSTCLIVGIIIGTGIYQLAPDVAKGAAGPWGLMALWGLGALLTLCGALAYAELAIAWPREGGDYVYLTRAYGRWAGFLFGWLQLSVVRPADIAAMAFAFATYARVLYDPLGPAGEDWSLRIYAAAAIVVLTAINIIGVREGKWTQNLLTAAKALGLMGIVGVALLAPAATRPAAAVESLPLSVALVFVLFTFGGWNEMAYVAAEVKDARRNITRALVLGVAGVAALYLLVNGAFLYTLGYSGVANSKAVAADSIATVFPDAGARLISALICISALGAVNGLVFAGARIYYAVGLDHRLFRIVGRWHPRTGTPVRALLLQGAMAVALVVVFGSFRDTVLYMAATVYAFYLATTAAVFVLRYKEPQVERPYRVTGYPVTPLVFAGVCAYLIYSCATYKPVDAAISCGIVLAGLPLYWLSRRFDKG
ncbi:MAG: amino acid permease [Planctomycetota bacterium]|nr:amino acid permease [Planctomycetota bacterium]